ncbi:MAG: hypothetical protein V4644_02600 [Patescibacteria group bacterium]
MKPFTLIALAAFAFVLPGAALAATYAYVNTSGEVQTIETGSPDSALAATNIAARSGVILVTGSNDSILGGGGSTDTMTESMAAADLRTALRTLLSEHVEYSVDVLRAIEEEDMDDSDENADTLDEALELQDQNAEDLGAAIGSVYGASAGTMFADMFKEHIVSSNDYTRALVNDDDAAADEALEELNEYLVEISAFLATANPNIDEATLLAALTEHERLLNDSSEAFIEGDEDEADDLEDEAITQIRGGADYLADAIIAQFPDKF